MELKVRLILPPIVVTLFQSNLYGIERQFAWWCSFVCFVSIEPLWNWKLNAWQLQFLQSLRFNRTFMELKVPNICSVGCNNTWFQSNLYGIESRLLSGHWRTSFCFNRTFMELKESCVRSMKIGEISFNRTFMELKGLLYAYVRFVALFQSNLYGIERFAYSNT